MPFTGSKYVVKYNFTMTDEGKQNGMCAAHALPNNVRRQLVDHLHGESPLALLIQELMNDIPKRKDGYLLLYVSTLIAEKNINPVLLNSGEFPVFVTDQTNPLMVHLNLYYKGYTVERL